MSDGHHELAQRVRALEIEMTRRPEISHSKHIARACTGAGQSIPSQSAPTTIVNFGTVTYDPRGCVTTGASWRYTAAVPGYYTVACWLLFASTTNWAIGEVANAILYVNGNFFSEFDRNANDGPAAAFKPLRGVSELCYLDAGHYLDIRVNQVSGASLALYNDAFYNRVSIALQQ